MAIELDNVTLDPASSIYDGANKRPVATVMCGDKILVEGTDYDVSFPDAINVGKYEVSVTGKGNYTGTLRTNFEITTAEIDDMRLSSSSFTYDGMAKHPVITVACGNKILVEGTDYDVSFPNAVGVGTYEVTVTGKGNYAGVLKAAFEIATAEIGDVSLSPVSFAYDGNAKRPTVTVTCGGRALTEGADYDASFPNAVDAGTYEVTVTGKGNYSGTLKTSFRILPSVTSVEVSETELFYDGTAKKPSLVVKSGNAVLTEGADYEVSWPNAIDAGTYEVTVIGKGNYVGTLKTAFEIVAAEIDNINLDSASFIYDGSAKRPVITVSRDGKTLAEGKNYEVSWPGDCASAGTKTIAVTGKGNYTGKLEASYEVLPASITSVSLSESDFIYDGSTHKPTLTVKSDNTTLTEGRDFEVSWPTNCASIGTKRATVTGKGNYAGTREVSYTITPAQYASCELSGSTLIIRGRGEVTTKDLASVLSSSATRKQITNVVFSEGITGV